MDDWPKCKMQYYKIYRREKEEKNLCDLSLAMSF